MTNDLGLLVRRILRDISVECKDEFDRNFQRQGFFNTAWQRRKSPTRPGGATLIDTSSLRRSFTVTTTGSTITFVYNNNYAAIHNEGGTITVTDKMKRFFRRKFYQEVGFQRKKTNSKKRRPLSDGGFYGLMQSTKTSSIADFWGYMALMKVGTKIEIPRRQFIGMDPSIERTVKQIITDKLAEYFNNEFKIEVNEK